MKILKMIGLVVAVHAVVLTFGFILPGCQSTVRTSPTSADKRADSNLSRIDAARAAGTVGQPAHTPAPQPPGAYAPPPAPGGSFAGGPVTDFSVPAHGATSPAGPQTAVEAAALASAEPEGPPAMLAYTVAPGDSLWKIAKKFKIKTDDLAAVNGLTTKSILQVGQKLKIPVSTGPAKPALAAQPGTTVYKVQSGDSLGSIARRHNTTVAQIQSLNKLSGASIRIGQELLVPVIADSPVAAASTTAATTDAPATAKGVTITHIVKSGENLEGIARHYGASITEIGTTNHITDPRKLQAGQKLTITSATKNIPAGTPPPAAAPVATGTAQSAQTTPPPPVETPPVSPVSPVIESPVTPATETPAYDNPPVNTPQDPVTSPINVPQN